MEAALGLYAVIAPFMVQAEEDEPTATYVSGILVRMRERDAGAYVRCVEIMAGIPESKMIDYPAFEILEAFIDGLRANQIVHLYRFGEGLTYAR